VVGDRIAYLAQGHFRFVGDWAAAERSSGVPAVSG